MVSRGAALAATTLLLLLLGMATGWQPPYQIAFALAVVMLLSVAWVLNSLWQFSVARPGAAQTAQVGHKLTDSYLLSNGSPLPKLDVEIRDYSTLPGHRASALCSIGPHQSLEHHVETVCSVRGVYTLGPTNVAASDPFGLFVLQRNASPPVQVTVYPEVVDLGGFSVPHSLMSEGTRRRRHTPLQTLDAAGTRAYSYGDSVRRIHWLSTAHSGELMVKEFEYTPAADVCIFLDMQRAVQVGSGVQSTEEYAVTAASSLAGHFIRLGRSVGIIASSRRSEAVDADRGQRQLIRVLELLAAVRADGDLPLHDFLSRERARLHQAAANIIISSSLDERWPAVLAQILHARSRTAALLVESSTFGDAPRATTHVAALAAAGIPTYLIKRGRTIGQALTAALSTTWQPPRPGGYTGP